MTLRGHQRRTIISDVPFSRPHDLHNDLKYAENSSWASYTFRDYLVVDEGDPDHPVVSIGPRAKLMRQYMHYVEAGAVRIGASSDSGSFDPLAFVNEDGRYVAVVKAAAGGSFSIAGLPAGTYGVNYTTPGEFDVDLPDAVVDAGGVLVVAIPRDGVITIYQETLPGESLSLEFSTLLGGNGFDRAQGCFVAGDGSIYLGGNTSSTDFPATPGAYDTTHNGPGGGQDGFVAKLSADGTQLLWATHLGGSQRDQVYGVRVDEEGYVYAVGVTSSADFPTTPDAYDRTFNGGSYGDVFVTKLAPDGSGVVYSTFVGGSNPDGSRGAMFVAEDGSIYVAGHTQSTNFPTTPGAYQRGYGGGSDDAFVFRLSADGAELLFSSYLGGSDGDHGYAGVFVLDDGSFVTAGATGSADFPTTAGAYQTAFGGGSGGLFGGDGFISRFTADGSDLVYSTFLGGSGNDTVLHNQGLTVDAAGRAIVVGDTTSTDLPTTSGAFQDALRGGTDGFVAKLSRDGSSLLASTYIGGSQNKEMSGIAVDADGNVYVSGNTQSTDYPVTADAFQPGFGGGDTDAMFSKLSPDLSTLLYSTYLGGSGFGSWGDRGRCVWLFPGGGAVLSGDTNSADFPTTPGVYQEGYAGGSKDALVARFVPAARSPGVLQFAAVDFNVMENGTAAVISVTRAGGSRGEVTVDFTTADGTAGAGADYTGVSGSLTWADGDALERTFSVPILNDAATEGGETVRLVLSNPTGGARLGAQAAATLTIVDDDVDLATGLVAHWALNDGRGTTAFDSTGTGNHGTLANGPAWTTGRISGGLRFDGQNDFVDVADAASLNPASAITLAAWVNSANVASGGIVISKGNLGSQYYLRVFPESVRFVLFAGDSGAYYEPGYSFSNNTWYHLAAVYDGAAMRIYVNGNLIGAPLPKTGKIGPTAGIGLAIGKRAGSTINHFAGIIDDVRVYDRALAAAEVDSLYHGPPTSVTGRYVFYNGSAFDGDDPAAGPGDDEAIAPDKSALLPGQTATKANYTSYVRGINGIMVDMQSLPGEVTLDVEDFHFRVGNDNNPDAWGDAPVPRSISVRRREGVGGSDRVTIVFDDCAVAKQWLQVTVSATADTGLAEDDVFYFGNAIGEAGNSSLNAIVNVTDEIATRNFQHGPTNLAAIDDPYDYNRDRLVNATARGHSPLRVRPSTDFRPTTPRSRRSGTGVGRESCSVTP